MFNSPIARSKRSGKKRYKARPFGKKEPFRLGGACLYCGFFTSNDLRDLQDDSRVGAMESLNKNCRVLWVCPKHVEPLLTLRWKDILLELTS